MLAVDVLCYFDNIPKCFRHVASNMESGGMFAFTIEILTDEILEESRKMVRENPDFPSFDSLKPGGVVRGVGMAEDKRTHTRTQSSLVVFWKLFSGFPLATARVLANLDDMCAHAL